MTSIVPAAPLLAVWQHVVAAFQLVGRKASYNSRSLIRPEAVFIRIGTFLFQDRQTYGKNVRALFPSQLPQVDR
jgi:hypothetical protein